MGVYGYVEDAESSESVLANNPDAGTGMFTYRYISFEMQTIQ